MQYVFPYLLAGTRLEELRAEIKFSAPRTYDRVSKVNFEGNFGSTLRTLRFFRSLTIDESRSGGGGKLTVYLSYKTLRSHLAMAIESPIFRA